MRPGECVRLYAGTKEDRPGVVMRVGDDGRAVVLCGTRTPRPELRHILLEPRTPAGKALEIYAPTYFYATGSIAVVHVSKLSALGKLLPPGAFHDLEELIGQ